MLTDSILRDRDIALHHTIVEARITEADLRSMPDPSGVEYAYLPNDPVPLILAARRPIVADGWLCNAFDKRTAAALWGHATGRLSFEQVSEDDHDVHGARTNLARMVDHLDRALRAAGPGIRQAARWALDPLARKAHVNHLLVTSPAMPEAIVRRANRQAVAVMRVVDDVLGTSYAVDDIRRRRQFHDARHVHYTLTDGRTLVEAREAERHRRVAAVQARIKGIFQSRRPDDRSLLITLTVPPSGSTEQDTEVLRRLVDSLRDVLRHSVGEMNRVAVHIDKKNAIAHRDQIIATGAHSRLLRLVGGAWAVLAGRHPGRDAMGVVGWHPHDDGRPHVHVSLLVNAETEMILRRWAAGISNRRKGQQNIDIQAEVADLWIKGARYALGTVLKRDPADRDWSAAHGIRPVGWIGVSRIAGLWQAVYRGGEEMPNVAKEARQAMIERRYGDAMRLLGALPGQHLNLRLVTVFTTGRRRVKVVSARVLASVGDGSEIQPAPTSDAPSTAAAPPILTGAQG